MIAILGLVLGVIGSMVLGIIVLASVPTFRISVSNLFVFVFGAFLGMFALSNLLGRGLNALGLLKGAPIDRQNELIYVWVFLGALIGGTVFVWLKLRLQKKRV